MKKLYLLAALLLIATTAASALPGFHPTGNSVPFEIGRHWDTLLVKAPGQRPPPIRFSD
jgi:hypothetical protein